MSDTEGRTPSQAESSDQSESGPSILKDLVSFIWYLQLGALLVIALLWLLGIW